MTKIKAGLIQMSLKGSVEHDSKELIRKKMIESHSKLIEISLSQIDHSK